jgi:hypothetical protein
MLKLSIINEWQKQKNRYDSHEDIQIRGMIAYIQSKILFLRISYLTTHIL